MPCRKFHVLSGGSKNLGICWVLINLLYVGTMRTMRIVDKKHHLWYTPVRGVVAEDEFYQDLGHLPKLKRPNSSKCPSHHHKLYKYISYLLAFSSSICLLRSVKTSSRLLKCDCSPSTCSLTVSISSLTPPSPFTSPPSPLSKSLNVFLL